MADGVHAPMHRVEPPLLDSPVDPPPVEPKGVQLWPRDHTVLARRESGYPAFMCGLTTNNVVKSHTIRVSPPRGDRRT